VIYKVHWCVVARASSEDCSVCSNRAVEGGTPPHRRAGPFPEDGFTDESPAPVAPPQPLTPHPQKAMQVNF
jgi:hypothetical protein